jgi:hypothetical protein
VQPLWNTLRRVLKKSKLDLPHDLALPLLQISLKEYRSGYNRDTCTSTFIASLFTIAKIRKQSRCHTTYEWIKIICHVYTMEYY